MEYLNILKLIWSKQREFNKNFVDFDNITSEDQQRMTKEYCLHLISEVTELLNSINWKIHHKSSRTVVNRRDVLLEWIDIFKYWLSIGLMWGFSEEDFIEFFEEKSGLVEQRFLQEYSNLTSDSKIAVCDIDGILGDYPYTFLKFISDRERDLTGEDVRYENMEVSCLDIYKLLEGKVPSDRIKKYKEEYRSTGAIRDEMTIDGAKEFLKSLKDIGYYVVLLTSRPFDQYKSLYLDTYVWLNSNGLTYDMLLSDSKKRDKISKIAETADIRFVLDDDPKIVNYIVGLDRVPKIYIMNRSYNKDVNFDSSKVVKVSSFSDILSMET